MSRGEQAKRYVQQERTEMAVLVLGVLMEVEHHWHDWPVTQRAARRELRRRHVNYEVQP